MKVAELLSEGFSGFTVSDSDSAWDLNHTVEEAVEKAKEKFAKNKMLPEKVIEFKACDAAIVVLKKGLKDKGNAYNTHGTLNVAMIMLEKWSRFRKLPQWKQFAGEVATKLEAEAKASKQQTSEYTEHMYKFAKQLAQLAK